MCANSLSVFLWSFFSLSFFLCLCVFGGCMSLCASSFSCSCVLLFFFLMTFEAVSLLVCVFLLRLHVFIMIITVY